jgi:hypothetical protein
MKKDEVSEKQKCVQHFVGIRNVKRPVGEIDCSEMN